MELGCSRHRRRQHGGVVTSESLQLRLRLGLQCLCNKASFNFLLYDVMCFEAFMIQRLHSTGLGAWRE